MKVAIVFSGILEKHYKVDVHYEENLLSVLKNNNIEYDIFIHSWDTQKDYIQDVIDIYNPKSIILETIPEEQYSYFYGMNKAFQLAKDYELMNGEYNAIIGLQWNTKIYQRFDINELIDACGNQSPFYINMNDNCYAQHMFSPLFYIYPNGGSNNDNFLSDVISTIKNNKQQHSGEKYYTDSLLKNFWNIKYSSIQMTVFNNNDKEDNVYNSLYYESNRIGNKSSHKVYDCFTFFNELDILDIRLNIMNEYVDKFIICEGTKTFQGKARELLFEKNKERYAEFLDKIEYVICDDYSELESKENITAWDYEKYQRDYLIKGLERVKAEDDDFIIISDVDEIPNLEQKLFERFDDFITRGNVLCFRCKLFYYYLNNIFNEWDLNHEFLFDSRIATYKKVKELNGLNELRRTNAFFSPYSNYGWHFSFIGNEQKIKEKIQSFSHVEYNTEEILNDVQNKIGSNEDLFNRNLEFYVVNNRNYFPKYIIDNWNKFKEKGLITR